MKKYGFGLDLGGTTCKVGLFTTDGTIVEKWEVPTDRANNGENILPNLAKAVNDKLAERGIDKSEVEGIGIGVPGPVMTDGVVNMCANLGWRVKPVAKELSELTGLRVEVGNDANVAALGEAWKGAAAGTENVVMVTLGTGIGGGIILGGKILPGVHGAGGEIGHITANPDETEACGCGRKGCIEQYASATGYRKLAVKKLAESDRPSVLRSIDNFETKDVFDAAKNGDAIALEAVDEAIDMLGYSLSAIAAVVDPEVFVLGGGVSKAGAFLTDKIEASFKAKAFHACRDTKFAIASLGNDAGMYGAVKMIL